MDSETEKLCGQLIQAVGKEAYKDVVKSGAAREIGSILTDIAKTIRLFTAPIQYSAYLQDRLTAHFAKAIKQVSPDQLINPVESLSGQIFDKLRYEPEDSYLSDLYSNLLARAMDRSRIGEAHPAFLLIISQLSSDEILLIEQLANIPVSIFGRKKNEKTAVLSRDELVKSATKWSYPRPLVAEMEGIAIAPEKFKTPENAQIYIDHLRSLELLSYNNTPPQHELYNIAHQRSDVDFQFWFIKLSAFGALFYKACVSKNFVEYPENANH